MSETRSLHISWVVRSRQAGTRCSNDAGEREMDFQCRPEVGSGVPYSPINGPGVMACPVADYCVMARGDSLMSFSGGRWTTYEPNVHMSDSSAWWDTLSCPTEGVLRGGHYEPRDELFGRVGERDLEDPPGSQLGRRRVCFGGVLRGNRKVRSRRGVRTGRAYRDFGRRSVDGEQGPHSRSSTNATDRRGYLRGVGHHFVPEPRYVPCRRAVWAVHREVDNRVRVQRAREQVAAMVTNEARRVGRTVHDLGRDARGRHARGSGDPGTAPGPGTLDLGRATCPGTPCLSRFRFLCPRPRAWEGNFSPSVVGRLLPAPQTRSNAARIAAASAAFWSRNRCPR